MFKPRMHRLPNRISFFFFAFVALAALGYPQSVSAITHRVSARVSAGIQINAGDYDYLSVYGEWVSAPRFGTVWHPYVVAEWEPFFHGHWSWTNDGWTWISYEPFGWLVYHYGYWYYDTGIGWFWVPGRTWSPARVQWYSYGDYCAWAPLPPPDCFWPDPWDRHDFNIWVMVNINDFTDDEIGRHRIAEPYHREMEQRGEWAKRAPDIRHVETVTHRQIPAMRITKERIAPQRQTGMTPSQYNRSRAVPLKRIVLPEQEMNKVRQYAPQVEREVLVPRVNRESAPREEQKPPERTPVERQERTIRRR